ncbi:hypothetical protein A0J61_10901, partial [Choanephora cucurbitarum]
ARSLHQGDPLSPLLFNLVFEHLLLFIQQDTQYHGYRPVKKKSIQEIKCIAYADDICVFVRHPEDFLRLQSHLLGYAKVSNARFNLFTTNSITTYYTKFSPNSLRYLGYPMAYTVPQQKVAEENLLETVRSAVAHYARRSLSFRGKITILNTLILSEVWYSLRLLRVTTKTLETIQSLCYQFVWMGKTPRLAFDTICLPRTQGGLGVINPYRHYLVLQMKWLFALFSTTNSPIRKLLTHHFALLQNTDNDPLFSFYSPEHRPLSNINPTSIVHFLYKTFDYPDVHFTLDRVPLNLLLRLSLRRMFVSVSTNY